MEQNAVPDNLSRHGTTPSGKPRLFVCGECTRAFARLEHLKRHERSHTKEKPFGCGVCQRRFSRRDLLLRHAQKLHAGCDDAIKRMRRRSSKSTTGKRGSVDAGSDGTGSNHGDDASGTASVSHGGGGGGGGDLKRFKNGDMNFFFATNNDIHGSTHGTGIELLRPRQVSFSAASGANYASASINNHNPVEFATPQLLPVELMGATSASSNANVHGQSWMDPLPALDFLNNFSLADDNSNGHATDNGNGNVLTDTHRGSTTSLDATSHRSSTGQSIRSNKLKRKESANDVFGYSFYDDDYVLGQQLNDLHAMKLSYPKLPSTYLNDQITTSSPSSAHNGTSAGHSNDYVLLSDLEVPNNAEKILSVGYSFYESNDSTSGNANGLGWRKPQDSSRNSPMEVDRFMDQPFLSGGAVPNMSSSELFTEATIVRINKVMERYPFVGLPPPNLPSVEYLNHYVENFKTKFLTHYPFIHKNLFNEASMFKYTVNMESPKDFAPTVCLPLLIATIGALHTNQKQQAADLYEYSRRCIHVYLDSRKKNDEAEKNTTHNSPLWLVQSLVLSVLYGLFGEYDDSDLSIILRQVNALCTLIKVSKFNLIQFNHENIEINEDYFQDYIIYQSKARTVFMIFNISAMLTCIYNMDLFINYKEIKCDLPDLESYWKCANVHEFKKVCIDSNINYNLNAEKILNDMLFNNQINYKISEFGSVIMMNIVLQYFYFNKRNVLTNYSVGISPDHMNSSNLVKNYLWEDMLTDVHLGMNMESIILRNVTVIRSLMIDLSSLKEAIWGRRWKEVCSEFMNISPKTDDLVDAVDYSVRTLSMMFINDVESSNFKRSLSLTLQWLFFKFFYIAKFLHKFERLILKQVLPGLPVRIQEAKLIPKFFSIYVKTAKFLADLEQLLSRNFDYHDPHSQLKLNEFDASKITFGYQRLVEAQYPSEVNMDNVVKIVGLRLSSNALKIGEFILDYIFKNEANFNIFKGLAEGLHELREFLEKDLMM